MTGIGRKPKASMADVEHALKGIDFPKNKNEIVSFAQQRNASNEVIADLKELPNRMYSNVADIGTSRRPGGMGRKP